MATSPRRAREIARTREDILEAAARALARTGFQSATMQEIAKEAGYTAASLYGYFSSKEEILRALFERIRSEIEAVRAKPLPEGLSFRQKLDLLMRRQIEVAERHRAVMKVFHFAGDNFSHLCVETNQGLTRVEFMAREIEAFFREEATPEELGNQDPAVAALIWAGITYAFHSRWMRNEGEAAPTELTSLLDFFFHGVLGPKR